MSAKNITTEKMNTSGIQSGGGGDNEGRGPRVLTRQPNNVSAKGPKGGQMAKPKTGGTGKQG